MIEISLKLKNWLIKINILLIIICIILILKGKIAKKEDKKLSKELEDILIEINEAYSKVSKFDECLPSYFKSIVENLIVYVAREKKKEW